MKTNVTCYCQKNLILYLKVGKISLILQSSELGCSVRLASWKLELVRNSHFAKIMGSNSFGTRKSDVRTLLAFWNIYKIVFLKWNNGINETDFVHCAAVPNCKERLQSLIVWCLFLETWWLHCSRFVGREFLGQKKLVKSCEFVARKCKNLLLLALEMHWNSIFSFHTML